MLIRFYQISVIAALLLCFSCRKEADPYNREDVIVADTSTQLFKATYLSHNLQDLNFQLELLTFNSGKSESSYQGLSFDTHDFSSEFDITFSNISTKTYNSSESYNTTVILDLSSRDIYRSSELGIYLRRFFEIADSLPNKKVAFSSFEPAKLHPTRFHSEKPGDLFGNSWQYNTETMYDLISENTPSGSIVPMLFFKNRMIETIDSISAQIGASAEKSLTLVMAVGSLAGVNQTDIDDIISKAVDHNVSINLITMFEEVGFQRIAIETGGFCTGLVPYIDGNYEESESTDKPMRSAIVNLDAMLTRKVTAHQVDVKISKQGTDVWVPNEERTIYYVYDQHRRNIQIKIP